MKTFIENTEVALVAQTNKFCNNVDDVEATLDLDAAEVLKFKTSNKYLQFVFNEHINVQTYSSAFTEYKNQLITGPSKELMGELPKAPVYPLVPVTISFGDVRFQFATMIQHCVASKNFTRDIGIILGFVKPESAPKDTVVVVPNLSVKLTTEGHPILHATKGIYQGYDVWKDSNDGKGYVKLNTSLYPDFIDVSDLPALGIGKTWKYKIIYLLKGEHAGTWSAEVTIGVFGLI